MEDVNQKLDKIKMIIVNSFNKYFKSKFEFIKLKLSIEIHLSLTKEDVINCTEKPAPSVACIFCLISRINSRHSINM